METVPDYLKLWAEVVNIRSERKKQSKIDKSDIWSGRAHHFEEGIQKRWQKSDSSRRWLLNILRQNPDSTLLDIGAGTGAWACLVAPLCRKVTAIEPSPAMIELLQKNIAQQGLTNVEIIPESWPMTLDEPYDYTLSSHSIYGTPDFQNYIEAMIRVTRKMCILLLRAPLPDSLMAKIAGTVLGQPHDSANFQIAYNALLQMGIYADVIMEDSGLWSPWSHETIDDALEDVKRKMGLSNSERFDDFLFTILQKELRPENGRLIWPAGVRSALVYWQPDYQ